MDLNHHPEHGGVIYWIFIAVALFAALSFTVSRIGRSGGSAMGERATLQATEIMQYANAIQRGIRNMRIEGIDETYLCFHTDQWGHTDYEFTPQCNNNENRVFHPDGGGIKFQEGVEDWYDSNISITEAGTWIFSARYEVTNAGTDGGTGNSEDANVDLLIVTAPLTDTICEALNSQLGYTPATAPAVPAGTYTDLRTNKFTGSYSGEPGSKIGDIGRERCVSVPGTPTFNMYYKVILAR